MLCYGIGMVFDPLLIMLVDCIVGDWKGDSFKLYQYFSAKVLSATSFALALRMPSLIWCVGGR